MYLADIMGSLIVLSKEQHKKQINKNIQNKLIQKINIQRNNTTNKKKKSYP